MGKGNRNKSIQRSVRRHLSENLHINCVEFFNSLCELKFNQRVKWACKIIFKRKIKE